MRIMLFIVIIVSFLSGICFALSIEDNGYVWNSSSYEERIKVCKVLASSIGKDFMWWFGAFSTFYNNTDRNILRVKIKEAAVLLPCFDEQSQ